MEIYDVKTRKIYHSYKIPSDTSPVFIVATANEFPHLLKELRMDIQSVSISPTAEIRYESHAKFDYLNFVYYELKESEFLFENFNLFLTKNYLLFVVNEEGELHDQLINNFFEEVVFSDFVENSLVSLYYQFLNAAFKRMFEALYSYETYLSQVEDAILVTDSEMKLSDIVSMKNDSLEVKKYNRQLLFVGDQIILNDNGFVKSEDMRYLQNIDTKINKLYEYSVNVHEMASHLMDIYNSSVTKKTNDLINKLTIFTVFATPLTVITGLYGMNFVNMPELENEYGYFIVLGVMALTVIIIYFVLKKIKLL